jgi:acetyl esterase/lipase
MKRILPIAALLCGATALFLTLWILVPAPLPALWLVAVVSSEWSLHIGLMALAGVLLGLVAVRRTWTRTGTVAIGSGVLALALAAYPLIVTLPVAALYGINLSLGRYSFAWPRTPLPEVQTLAYADVGGQTLQLDVYLPEAPPARMKRPAVVVVHGGSWKSGRRSDFPQWNAWLAAEGFVVFDIDYRLTPQPNWRTATEDVQQAVRWIKARADVFDVDPARIALMGRSAGGHLALLAAYTAQESDTTEVAANAHVQAVVAFYAPTDLRWGYAHPANPRVIDGRATLRQFTGGTPESVPEVYTQASPIHHAHADSPATLLVHGEQDQLVLSEQANRLFKALQRVSDERQRHQALLLPYAQHGFDYNFNGWGAQVTKAVLLQHLNTYVKEADE